MRRLDLKDGIRSTVYTTIVEALKADPVLAQLISSGGWRTFTEDDNEDATPPGEDSLPAIEVLPFGMAASPASQVMQGSPMGLSISICTEGLDCRDLLNLWEAVERAAFKGDGLAVLRRKVSAALEALPEPRGQVATISLSSPAMTPDQAALNKQMMAANGQITVEMRVPK